MNPLSTPHGTQIRDSGPDEQAPQDQQRRQVLARLSSHLMGLGTVGALLHPASPAGAASNFPLRPVKIVVPFSPGGGTDVIGRALLEGMQQALGQAVFMENKPGAGSVIGTDLVAKAPADGHTLLMTTSAVVINASLVPKLPYSTEKDLTGISLICRGPNVLVVHPDSKLKTVSDVIAAAKSAPGKLSYASSGNGSAVHLAGELFKSMAGVDITHVPYKGAGPANTDLLGGQVDLLFGTAGAVAKFVEAGKMRALAMTSAQRSSTPVYQSIPTISETLPGYEAEVWYALLAPGGTPPHVIDTLFDALRKSANTPAYLAKLAKEGLRLAIAPPEETQRFLRADLARWRKVVVEGKVSLD
ncbi:tripartite tricarboxylate transporter substrate binding protein [Curvibacter sp. RS43]|uniref:tripartite tricarboxylate transporter substrate binding protein n=1 Tax=Curvibacter microcysteis TaxID=3026419 RepID=UPI00235FC823|nr:tripartite tricarboxylate transporter substrate binding protein [Curvibacter sp. RS43]MDD0811532.1 tripartite tricarboxylate transporter substrate binding protein [Curvibacter sp. RS43]